MSESESEPETEVFFRDGQGTVHQFLTDEQNEQTARRENSNKLPGSRSSDRVDPDKEYPQSPVYITDETEVSRAGSSVEKAVGEMVKMQTQISEVLKNVADVLVNTLNKRQQDAECMSNQLNNNNPADSDGDQIYSELIRERKRRREEANRGDYLRETERERIARRSPLTNRWSQEYRSNFKLPPFTGKDDWQVWINRFETIAERQNWSEEQKLDQLLPKLEGVAGEFVYTQLRREVLTNYEELIAEINNRFRIIETPRTFAAKYSKRDQRVGETAEEYAAELKRLYDKAYRSRDSRTRREDLVRRFLDGLRNEELSWEVEYIKEPDNIDEAVYHVVNCIQMRNRHKSDTDQRKRQTRRADYTEEETQNAEVSVCRISGKNSPANRDTNRKLADTESRKSKAESTDCIESSKLPTDTELLLQILDKLSKLVESNDDRKGQHSSKPPHKKKTLICYACNKENHYARDCPFKSRDNEPTDQKGVPDKVRRVNHYADQVPPHELTDKIRVTQDRLKSNIFILPKQVNPLKRQSLKQTVDQSDEGGTGSGLNTARQSSTTCSKIQCRQIGEHCRTPSGRTNRVKVDQRKRLIMSHDVTPLVYKDLVDHRVVGLAKSQTVRKVPKLVRYERMSPPKWIATAKKKLSC